MEPIKTWQERTRNTLDPARAARLSESNLAMIGTEGMLAEIADLRAALASIPAQTDASRLPVAQDEREAFEKVCRENAGKNSPLDRWEEGGAYKDTIIHAQWMGWQARAAIASQGEDCRKYCQREADAELAGQGTEPVAGIRGPLRTQDYQDVMAFARTLGIPNDDADVVVRQAAVKGYVNARADFAAPPAAVTAAQAGNALKFDLATWIAADRIGRLMGTTAIKVDPSMPPDEVSFRLDGKEVGRIVSFGDVAAQPVTAQELRWDDCDVICDRRDLFDVLRAAWREGQAHGGEMHEAESWSKATDHATKAIQGWATLRHVAKGGA